MTNLASRGSSWLLGLALAALAGAGCVSDPVPPAPSARGVNAATMNERLGRGVNFGNALEAPSEGAWGVTLEPIHFRRAAEAGFQTVRLPVRWSAHADDSAPYTIDSTFFRRIDWAIGQALANDLNVILNVHHYEELIEAPADHRERWLAIWRQIALRYADEPENVLFELLNEPYGPLTAELWNQLLRDGIAVIRQSNPYRNLVVGPVGWNNTDYLADLSLPDDDRLIATIHFYEPFRFTHQDASWVGGSGEWAGTEWLGTESERAAVTGILERAADWGDANGRPIFVGEFGAYSAADMDSRTRWTGYVAREAERLGMSWAYWEFMSGFGLYDPQTDSWRAPLRDALLPPE